MQWRREQIEKKAYGYEQLFPSKWGGVLIKPPPPSPLPPVPTHVHVYRHDERTSTSGNIYLFGL